MKRVVFRVDASPTLASGHIMRCLTLAKGMRQKHPNIEIVFIANKLPPSLEGVLSQSNFPLITLPFNIDSAHWNQKDDAIASTTMLAAYFQTQTPAIDLLIVDHYYLDITWQKLLKTTYKKLLVIDDLANRQHCANYLLDQTIARQPEAYVNLVPSSCHLLLGQRFMLLRNEFIQLIAKAKIKRQQTTKINNILLNLGGVDLNNTTLDLIEAVSYYRKVSKHLDLKLAIVLTSYSPHVEVIKKLVKDKSWINLTVDCNHMAKKMLSADLAIGACGSSAWERCSLGLPTLAIVLADNQSLVCENLANKNAIINLGHYQNLSKDKVYTAITSVVTDKNRYNSMVNNCFNSCDGQGLNNVLNTLTLNKVTLLKAELADLTLTFKWQSNPDIRKYSRNSKPVSYDEHVSWFSSSLTMPTRHLFIICFEDKKVGVLRLDKNLTKAFPLQYEISILIAPEAQGKGIALQALQNIPKYFDNAEIFAHVHIKNRASQQLFKRAKFRKIADTTYVRTAIKEEQHNEK